MARRLAAIMFTDIAGYTAMAEVDEAAALRWIQDQERLVRGLLEVHRGRLVKSMGDGLLVEFANALDAVECAVDLQRQIRERNARESPPELWVRVGIHLGDVEDVGSDILGDAVNITFRVEPLADPGGVTLTESVCLQVQNKVSFPLEKLGERTLKGVRGPVDVYRVVLPLPSGESPRTTSTATRLAVLPFTNLSPDPADEYFADGMTEELITALSRISGLTVIARTSVMQYKGTTTRAAQIAQELGVARLIEGSVRKAGNRVRITAQLVDAVSEGHLWSENYDGDMGDIFEIQSNVARQVSDALEVRVLPAEQRSLDRCPTTNREAYLLYLKGRYHWNQRSPNSVRLAIEYFEKAVGLDPSFAAAYAGLADGYFILGDQAIVNPRDANVRARELAEKALALDSGLAEAHTTLGSILTFELRDWVRAESEYRQAIEANPAYPTAHQWYALHLFAAGRNAEGLEEIERAHRLDPFSSIINCTYAWGLAIDGRRNEGIALLEKQLARGDQNGLTRAWLSNLYVSSGELERAKVELERSLEAMPDHPGLIAYLGRVLALMHRRSEAEEMLERLRSGFEGAYVCPVFFALVEFSLGDTEAALRHLRDARADQAHFIGYYLASPSPGWEDLQQDDRVGAYLADIRSGIRQESPKISEA